MADTKDQVVEKAHTLQHAATDNPQRMLPVVALLLIGGLAAGIVIWRRRR